ncbi:MAG: TRAP transporter large permease subunit [Pelagibacteraceae bacterium]|jgi:C4-dicarboxylate transporter DctM subunit
MTTILILLALFFVLFIGVPIAFALGSISLFLMLLGDISPLMIPQTFYSVGDNFVLLSVPMFLMMSNILLKAGIGEDLFNFAQSWVGHFTGGLAVATVISCAIFAAVSGSSVATAATISTVAFPAMIRRGYHRNFTLGILAAGGTLGILIPPSIPMIVYAFVAEESVLSMFLAGIGPGIMLTIFFIIFAIFYVKFFNKEVENIRSSTKDRIYYTKKGLPIFAMAILMLSGLYAGIYTPTEAGGVGFMVSLAYVLWKKRLSLKAFIDAGLDTMKTTVTVFIIIAGAKMFGKVISLYRIPQNISSFIVDNIDEKGMFILVVCITLLILGFIMETLSLILIMMPIFAISLKAMNIDIIWFGIIFTIMIECALITPPVGLNIYVLQSIGKANMSEIGKGVIPFVIIMMLSIFVIYFYPDIALYIPFKL